MLGEEKEIGYRSSGKPYLADGSASISISHTKGYVAVLLGGPEKEVGIDVECYGERVRKVAHKFVREDESLSWYKVLFSYLLPFLESSIIFFKVSFMS